MTRDIVVVGASSGGVSALRSLVAGLPEDFPSAVLVVQHTPPDATSTLPRILSRAGPLPATHARDGEPALRRRIYVAPPDHHLVLEPEGLKLTRGPRENMNRPSADVLFRSAARSHGARVVGVVLTGSLGDGAAGLREIQAAGGLTLVQDPKDAASPSMPLRALEAVRADYVAPLSEIPSLLVTLAGDAGRPASAPAAAGDTQEDPGAPHAPSALTCPECGGALWEVGPEGPHFRCHVGHAFDGSVLLRARSEQVEQVLWSAVRQMMERGKLLERLASDAERRGSPVSAGSYRRRAAEAWAHAGTLRRVLEAVPPGGDKNLP